MYLSLCPVLASDFLYLVRPLGFYEHDVIQNKALVAVFRSERGQTTEELRIFFLFCDQLKMLSQLHVNKNPKAVMSKPRTTWPCARCEGVWGNRVMAEFTPDLALEWGEWSASHFDRFISQGAAQAGWITDKILTFWGREKSVTLLGIKARIFQPTAWSPRCHGLPGELTPNI